MHLEKKEGKRFQWVPNCIYVHIIIIKFTLFKADKSLMSSMFSSSSSESVQTISSSTCSNKSSALLSGNSSISSFSIKNIGLKDSMFNLKIVSNFIK